MNITTWNKFDSLDSATWPTPGLEVLWKITINQVVYQPIHILGNIKIVEGRPTVFYHIWREDYYLDKNTETVYWMEISEAPERIVPPGEGQALLEGFQSLLTPDDTFNF